MKSINQATGSRSMTPMHCCYMGTALKHPVPDRVKPSFVVFDIRALWRSGLSVRVAGCQKFVNYKWQLNPVWHRMLYSRTHMNSNVDIPVHGCQRVKKAMRTRTLLYDDVTGRRNDWEHSVKDVSIATTTLSSNIDDNEMTWHSNSPACSAVQAERLTEGQWFDPREQMCKFMSEYNFIIFLTEFIVKQERNCSWDPVAHRAAPYEELFSWGTRQHCPMTLIT